MKMWVCAARAVVPTFFICYSFSFPKNKNDKSLIIFITFAD